MLHGDGYIISSAKGYRAYAAQVSQATAARVFVPERRLAPEPLFRQPSTTLVISLWLRSTRSGRGRASRSETQQAAVWCSAP